MFQKIKSGFKSFRRSPYSFPVILASFIGIASSITTIYSTTIIFPIISALSLLALFAILIIDQIKVAELRLKKGLEPDHLNLITKNMKEAVIIYTPDFKILDFNPAAEKLFRIKKEDIINQIISPSFVKNKNFKSLAQVIFPSLAPKVVQISDSGWPQITRVSTENGLHLISIFTRTTDRHQNSTSFVKIIQNKTEEREASQAKSEFITTAANQLQKPLEKIKKSFEELKEKIESEEKPKPENAARGAHLSDEILKTIKNLSDINKLEEGNYTYNFQNVNLSNLLKNITEKAKGVAGDYNISISLSSTPNIAATADPQKITAVISTLVDNAIKYNTEGGSVDISLKRKENAVEVTITDTGIGIQEDELKKIFEKFYRAERAKQNAPEGSGLSLYIAQKIIEKHGGSIWAQSTPDRGSTFHFTLPLSNRE